MKKRGTLTRLHDLSKPMPSPCRPVAGRAKALRWQRRLGDLSGADPAFQKEQRSFLGKIHECLCLLLGGATVNILGELQASY